MSADGRLARDVMLGLVKTCSILGVSFFSYLVIGSASKGSLAVSRFFQSLSPFGQLAPSGLEICATYSFDVSGADCGAV